MTLVKIKVPWRCIFCLQTSEYPNYVRKHKLNLIEKDCARNKRQNMQITRSNKNESYLESSVLVTGLKTFNRHKTTKVK